MILVNYCANLFNLSEFLILIQQIQDIGLSETEKLKTQKGANLF